VVTATGRALPAAPEVREEYGAGDSGGCEVMLAEEEGWKTVEAGDGILYNGGETRYRPCGDGLCLPGVGGGFIDDSLKTALSGVMREDKVKFIGGSLSLAAELVEECRRESGQPSWLADR